MIAAVADDVSERVFDGFDDGLVQFGVRPVHFEVDLFAERSGQIAHYSWQFVPNHPDGLHAGLHYAFLQLGGDEVQALRGGVKGGIFLVGVELQNLVAGQHQLAYQIHEFIEQYDIHPDAGVGYGRALRSGRLFRIGRNCGRLNDRRTDSGMEDAGGFQAGAQIVIGLGALATGGFDGYEDRFDYVYSFQNERD